MTEEQVREIVEGTENMRSAITYMETLDASKQKKKHNLAYLKGKIRFSDGYDYKSMRMNKIIPELQLIKA